MPIHHFALWTGQPERLRDFYCLYFGGTAGPLYENPKKGFRSYFVRFAHGPAIEIMSRADVKGRPGSEVLGYCHLAFESVIADPDGNPVELAHDPLGR